MDEREQNMGENYSGDGQRMPGAPDFSNSGQKPGQGDGRPQGGVHRDHMRWNGQQEQTQEPATQVGPAVQPSSQPFPEQQAPQQYPQPTSVQAPPSAPGQASFADPYQPQLSSQPQEKKRWSTPAVAALLLAGAVVASAVTYVGMDSINDNKTSNNATSSFDNSSSSSKSSEEKNASNPVKPGSTTDVANKVLPSVVSIRVTTSRGGDEGSGSVISSDGLILTNNHVVAGAQGGRAKMEVTLNDGRSLEAEVVATDPQTDIAVIKAKNVTDLQPIEFGDSDKVNVGEDVMAIGSPLGLSATVTTGIVSAKNRPVQASGEDGGEASLIDAIQTDASINPGNSGGALVDMEGKLIGIPSVIASTGGREVAGSIGLGFAIPINQAERISKQLIDNGKAEHPIIGAKVDTRSSENGAVIADVNKDSPADKAGLKKGDLVTHVDDRRVDSGVGLIAAIRSHAVGDKVKLKVKEGPDGKEREVELTLTTAE
ncbi:serine protease [Corynebacterium jeikeium]|jgi:putative serine protease PepD|nr:trypsin-like peptidase domain-containing protein [Corynebacterium jeikeium]SUY84953.1 serine protease [Corynebacterium jeikeium]